MAIMDCYPDGRAIENELGGKWELLDTLEIDGGEILTYEDTDDEKLNFNGIMLAMDLTVSANTAFRFYNSDDNNTGLVFQAVAGFSTSGKYSIFKVVNHNGFYDGERVSVNSSMADSSNVGSSFRLKTQPFINNYFRFAIVPTGQNTVTGTIKVYVLRGV